MSLDTSFMASTIGTRRAPNHARARADDMPIEIHIRDEVQTRKPHACGSDRWRIYRVGADIGMICLGCQRRVMLPRRKFERSLKKRFPAGDTSG